MNCRWKHNDSVCMLGLFDGKPSQDDCRGCDRYQGTARGAGDVVERVAKSVGIKPCSGCKRRKRLLNRLWPFGKN